MNISLISYVVIVLSAINLVRMAVFLIGSDMYELLNHLKRKKRVSTGEATSQPDFSVVIPAFNEMGVIERALSSVCVNDYPKDKLQIIVVDDGSTDDTFGVARKFAESQKGVAIEVVRQENAGKANALNFGIKNFARGELIMCLDADSYLAPDAITKTVAYFEDSAVVALAANVKIIKRPGILNLIQQFEYAISYQMKRAQSLFNVEYIIGGIGSTYRKSILVQVGYYDTNTITEDIDLTMKVLRGGNKIFRVIYGSDVVAYTEGVLSVPALINQRFRWKYGRCQTFFKNRFILFNSGQEFTKGLTWFYLPYALIGDILFIIEPVLVGYIWYISIAFHDPMTIVSALLVVTSYLVINILAETTFTVREKIRLVLLAPAMYLLFYVLSFVEYVALWKSLVSLPQLPVSIKLGVCSWQPVTRPAPEVVRN